MISETLATAAAKILVDGVDGEYAQRVRATLSSEVGAPLKIAAKRILLEEDLGLDDAKAESIASKIRDEYLRFNPEEEAYE